MSINLFTNIPISETCNIILNSNIYNHLGLTLPLFKQPLSLSVNDTIFTFNNTYFLQIDGMPMDSPLGPPLPTFYFALTKLPGLTIAPQTLDPWHIKNTKTIDFLNFKNKQQSNIFFQYINNKHSNIKFSREDESNGFLPFLDILVSHTPNGFTTSSYWKPTSSLA